MERTTDYDSRETAVSQASAIFFILRLSAVMIILCGILYPLASTALAQVLLPSQANGSLLKNSSGETVGSELIGQSFSNPALFHGRVSSIDYKAEASGSNNYGPSNPDMLQRTKDSILQWQKDNPDVPVSELPVDLITNSGSGLDPHISPAAARVQIPRISGLTGISAERIGKLVTEATEGRDLGLFGEERVNVLKLNLALSELTKR
ncbi:MULTISPECIES: potassium-transporting ATPase subunit KdpC [unclassified Paenibacillus]|uniref:potassium-transporting ATPase subunit KdpC n=1 Tax=unclassified Paenibacillus TaxID=185978 RepID=UPI0024059B87|nr:MULTISPECIES: potassium-transporting ATPase subunit KdpC [unclassified Paenibacillus]MDF9839292.1 K+-transporting ATPase ATPase C chain [Paenibacillus sp. PastF-2]MDF9845873.1 K+-transporting ATPase ATPase C chain [Paenibacillus sp. PastM-2]MDF9852446.1 K+-transporting ATPase ATPase C chain [Paenibacillus sp. PastF-1]MDH6477824.1 K+-transporting ATPase ATPase C chain [Paenibacillus sp. PastH-2]MDH6505563.1 K+-transporting ATPase ATPase C chain [Paenibacillus sp. PastM-3]